MMKCTFEGTFLIVTASGSTVGGLWALECPTGATRTELQSYNIARAPVGGVSRGPRNRDIYFHSPYPKAPCTLIVDT